ncbi:type VI secretion system baseplate subunit TssG [Spirosoma montaniterrae]|uniref:Type VI secretion system baseplate subunit TssG n=1 Tax=Spirosoma montaniterrae TaxID=1178516 RepID=A0A1P9WYS0_9BACT|nr:type VI secretion system baseplate subunit TssG [Spirosoma montaniterrae]AQG80530.1 hypothetical protein AWR27_15090 [Spirosoma montaniterrae]
MKKNLLFDVRAEVWLARQKRIWLVRLRSLFSRPFSPDVLDSSAAVPGPGLETDARADELTAPVLQVDVSREGLYDMLPEGILHPPRQRRDGAQALVDESRRLRQEERDSRLFWQPFEQESWRQRVQIEAQENESLTQITGPVWTELYNYLLGEAAEGLPDLQRACLLAIWTNAHQTVGNWPRTAVYFSRFLGVPVTLQHRNQRPAESTSTNWQPARLGNTRLGFDWVLPPPSLPDDGGQIDIRIGPLSARQLPAYLPGGIARKHVAMLAGYLFPADADWHLHVLPESNGFCLSDDPTAGRLGLTTALAG